MLLFQDIISDDEIVSDAYPMFVLIFSASSPVLTLHSKEIDDIVYEVDAQMIVVKKGADVDIGTYAASRLCILSFTNSRSLAIGANPSAEDAADDLEEGAESVNNLVYSFRLQSTQFDKKSYLTHLKVPFASAFSFHFRGS